VRELNASVASTYFNWDFDKLAGGFILSSLEEDVIGSEPMCSLSKKL
jgi:hypothetical protein